MYIRPAEIRELFGIPLSTLAAWRKSGFGPTAEQPGPGRRVRYPRAAALEWFAQHFPTAARNAGSASADASGTHCGRVHV